MLFEPATTRQGVPKASEPARMAACSGFSAGGPGLILVIGKLKHFHLSFHTKPVFPSNWIMATAMFFTVGSATFGSCRVRGEFTTNRYKILRRELILGATGTHKKPEKTRLSLKENLKEARMRSNWH